jgi:hypothetical protein
MPGAAVSAARETIYSTSWQWLGSSKQVFQSRRALRFNASIMDEKQAGTK